ncbi:MAG: hypothetical protein ABIC04_02030 [Nanoarchaeota archaeon]
MSNRYYSNRLKLIEAKKAKTRRPRSRPKSFKSEEAANKWADNNKVKDYSLKNLKNTENKTKKIVIVQ